jgi:hypothetical protein
MIQTIERETIVEMLLNSLEAERYVRRPLLENVIDELVADRRFAQAAELARALLPRLDAASQAEFERALRDIRIAVREAVPRSGVVAARIHRADPIDPLAGAA